MCLFKNHIKLFSTLLDERHESQMKNGKKRQIKTQFQWLIFFEPACLQFSRVWKPGGAGADAWRRTGVITFNGNRKMQKKPTFKRVKEHLEEKFNIKISYGSVVQLCIARNRRISASRYKGVANVLQKRARKGFTLKFNPDLL